MLTISCCHSPQDEWRTGHPPVRSPSAASDADDIADEYDAAQERGGIKKAGNPIVPGGDQLPGPADLGLSRKHIHNARIIRDAIKADPEGDSQNHRAMARRTRRCRSCPAVSP